MNPKLEMSESADAETRKLIYAGLAAHNRQSVPAPDVKNLWIVLRGADGAVQGGLIGLTAWSQLHVEAVYVPEALRGTGIGQEIMAMAETEAQRRGCIGVWLDTYSFQARGFYERLGYTVLGEIENYPPGHTRYFMKKALS
jgi:ribosomal protein S18 acetylase RimI-like enzyme